MKSVIYSFNTSTGFKCFDPALSHEQNQWAYGRWAAGLTVCRATGRATGKGLGCNFKVSYELPEKPSVDLLAAYKAAANSIDHMFLNQDIEYFKDKAITPEVIANYLFFEKEKDLKKESLYLTAYPYEAIYLNGSETTLIKKSQFLSRVMQVYLTKNLSQTNKVIDRGALDRLLVEAKEASHKQFKEGQSFSELCRQYFEVLSHKAEALGLEAGFVCYYEKNLFYSFGKTSPVIMAI